MSAQDNNQVFSTLQMAEFERLALQSHPDVADDALKDLEEHYSYYQTNANEVETAVNSATRSAIYKGALGGAALIAAGSVLKQPMIASGVAVMIFGRGIVVRHAIGRSFKYAAQAKRDQVGHYLNIANRNWESRQTPTHEA